MEIPNYGFVARSRVVRHSKRHGHKTGRWQKGNRWEAEDAKAQTLLVTRISEEVMIHIISCETSAKMWRKLQRLYEQKSETSIHIVQQRFFQFKYEEGA